MVGRAFCFSGRRLRYPGGMAATRLDDLPGFVVERVELGPIPMVFGVFTHLRSVRLGRSWLYDRDDPLIGVVYPLRLLAV